MKNFLLFIGLGLALISTTSCNKKGCTDSMASNFTSKAKEDDGSCKFDRDAFLGNYSATFNDLCYGTETGNMSITASASAKNKVVISVDGENLSGTVNGTGITLETQTVGGLQWSGNGSINGNVLTLNLTYYDSFEDETCAINVNANKQ
jgi:hypothetical protein